VKCSLCDSNEATETDMGILCQACLAVQEAMKMTTIFDDPNDDMMGWL